MSTQREIHLSATSDAAPTSWVSPKEAAPIMLMTAGRKAAGQPLRDQGPVNPNSYLLKPPIVVCPLNGTNYLHWQVSSQQSRVPKLLAVNTKDGAPRTSL